MSKIPHSATQKFNTVPCYGARSPRQPLVFPHGLCQKRERRQARPSGCLLLEFFGSQKENPLSTSRRDSGGVSGWLWASAGCPLFGGDFWELGKFREVGAGTDKRDAPPARLFGE